MDGSKAKIPPLFVVNCDNAGYDSEEIIFSFGRLGLSENGNLVSQPGMIPSNNAVSSSSSAQRETNPVMLEVGVENSKEFSSRECGIIDQLPVSKKTDRPDTNPVPWKNICAQSTIYNHMNLADQSDRSSILYPSASASNYQSNINCSANHMMNGIGSLNSVRGIQLPDGNNFNSGYGYGRNSSSATGMRFSDEQLRQIMSYGGYFFDHNIASSSYIPHQVRPNSSLLPEIDFLTLAKSRSGSEKLKEFLEQGNYWWRDEILNGVLSSIFELMVDDHGRHVFRVLVEQCGDDQLLSIVRKAYTEPDAFIGVAFTVNGSKSIQGLIKRLKSSPMAETITIILSRRCYELLTHKTGCHVIRQCLVLFKEGSKVVLYQAISSHLLDLAVDPVGCISLYYLLDAISGPRREIILNFLAEHSRFLSNDPSGNYVVQHILNLKNEQLTETILGHLKGNFEQLAQRKGGSHVVENCMRSSSLGLDLVVSEISKDGKAFCRLAQNQFGNYVIQTALKLSKTTSKNDLYPQLLNALRPYYPYLFGESKGKICSRTNQRRHMIEECGV